MEKVVVVSRLFPCLSLSLIMEFHAFRSSVIPPFDKVEERTEAHIQRTIPSLSLSLLTENGFCIMMVMGERIRGEEGHDK